VWHWALHIKPTTQLRVFKYRKTLGTKWEQVRVEWRKVHGEELHDLCSSLER